jgi:hypothetical protein
MIDPHHVFVADVKPALALPAQHSVYVFGAASTLGGALLNQLLASPQYRRVYVSTTATLPGSVAHLGAVLANTPFMLQDEAKQIDCVLIVNETDDVRPRNTVYAPLLLDDLAGVLRQFTGVTSTAQLRYLLVTPMLASSQASSFLSSYAGHSACMVYGMPDSTTNNHSKKAYQFKPQAQTLLDRLGVWVLNALSGVAHGMLNPQTTVPLTSVKTAQHLAQRFDKLTGQSSGSVIVLQPKDLIT